ncbi:uncharacterized protein HMPREF1541_09553 [Cyphellophora europaea CBS 101466]|uniref:D-serine dehydratase-like domain-containing protein n=1 Tax=Cyphellophora europaea (strain CBS 101466) TaxID=1220924 RepID=W2SAR3_CYPE1|nr:uncharacterized protein HMPREF1541_09553 [Cyphellophora europaea CBS 101466]ETN45720.1 hypothetical protein HMPREF1541_09553 [Cyphellophora europaea CBS 101466]
MTASLRSPASSDGAESDVIGRDIHDVAKPAVLLDKAKMQRHCQTLRAATERLGVDFRFHVKSHKTREGLKLQAGESAKNIRLVVSTIAELEHMLPILQDFQTTGRHVNVLYGIPLPRSQVSRLAALGRRLGAGSISVQSTTSVSWSMFPAGVFLKIDTGYHRAGLPPTGVNKSGLVESLMLLEQQGRATFVGLYSHSSLSYADSTPQKALLNLENEIKGCLDALTINSHLFPAAQNLTISVGASPQVTSIETLTNPTQDTTSPSREATNLLRTIRSVAHARPSGFRTTLELHAGVYALLDVQQLATHSRGAQLGACEDEIAVSVVAEICSVYNDGERAQPEALAAVGTLGLGREPCGAYAGWGVVDREAYAGLGRQDSERRLVVARVSQEHSIMAWEQRREGEGEEVSPVPPVPLEVGQTIRIYPNHACVAGALYPRYLIVDSSDDSGGRKVIDTWERARGW